MVVGSSTSTHILRSLNQTVSTRLMKDTKGQSTNVMVAKLLSQITHTMITIAMKDAFNILTLEVPQQFTHHQLSKIMLLHFQPH